MGQSGSLQASHLDRAYIFPCFEFCDVFKRSDLKQHFEGNINAEVSTRSREILCLDFGVNFICVEYH